MTTTTKTTPIPGHRVLDLDTSDRVDQLITQVGGIIDCISGASQSEQQLPDVAIPNACWAAHALLDQLRSVIYAAPKSGEVNHG